MKVRSGFVSNSSTSSFVVNKKSFSRRGFPDVDTDVVEGMQDRETN